MSYLWRVVKNIMGVIGFILIFSGISTSDYYVIELGQPEPSYVWTTIIIGVLLVLPTAVHFIIKCIKGELE